MCIRLNKHNNMKTIQIVIILLTLSVMITGSVHAHDGETDEHHNTLSDVLSALLAAYELDSVDELSCNRLTDTDFERIGDAWMEELHPGDAHIQMDTMMGGEGSESLRQMHIRMGKNYLGCSGGNNIGMGMMTNTRNSTKGGDLPMMGGYSMMGNPSLMSGYSAFGLVIWALFVVLLVVMIRYFWKKGGKE